MRRRAFTLLEILVTSAIVFLMEAMASFATISYLKAYRRYTEKALVLRLEAKTLESLTFRLRSSRVIEVPLPVDLTQKSLRFQEIPGQFTELKESQGKLWLGERPLGPACALKVRLENNFLRLTTQHLQTQISLQGIRCQP